jgi:predicted GNAT family acetyltransferase
LDLHASTDVEEYAAAATGFLAAEPASRSVLHGIILTARQAPLTWEAPAIFWWVTDVDGGISGAASWTPPYPLLVAALPGEIASALVVSAQARASGIGIAVPGVFGPRPTAELVAQAWRDATGMQPREHMAELLHVADRAVAPPPVPGRMRRATAEDIDLCAVWLQRFEADAGVTGSGDRRAVAAFVIGEGRVRLWEVDGTPVCMVGHTAATAGVVRVGPVYTPPPHRNRGYGRRLTYEVTRDLLAMPEVTQACRYTDVANPVSNSIYRQIGYRPVEDHVDIRFEAP